MAQMTDEKKKDILDRFASRAALRITEVFDKYRIDFYTLPQPVKQAVISVYREACITLLEEILEEEVFKEN